MRYNLILKLNILYDLKTYAWIIFGHFNIICIIFQIASIIGNGSWYTMYEKSINNPENIIEDLMESQQV